MEDLGTQLKSLSRPRLLSQAARAGIGHYTRKRDLPRILGTLQQAVDLSAGAVLVKLLDRERQQEQARQNRHPGYSLVRHLETLIAIAAEGQLFLASQATARTSAHENGRSKAGAPDKNVVLSDNYQRKLSGTDSFLFAT